jgi:hypothetical protein
MSKLVSSEIRLAVAERAGNICEYCLIAVQDSYYRHQIEHIISLKHGGSSRLENLALSCVYCNRNKGSDIASVIAGTHELVRFYNPRIHVWSEHFRLEGVTIISVTDIGEATSRILQFNNEDRLLEREVLAKRGRYPNNVARLLVLEN